MNSPQISEPIPIFILETLPDFLWAAHRDDEGHWRTVIVPTPPPEGRTLTEQILHVANAEIQREKDRLERWESFKKKIATRKQENPDPNS